MTALPAGSYNVHVHYAGDTTFAASDSASIPVSIGKEASTITNNLYAIDPSTLNNTPATVFTYGGPAIYLSTQLAGSSSTGVPTGNGPPTRSRAPGTGTVSAKLDDEGLTDFFSGFAYPAYYLKPNFPALPAGTYSIATSYPGDTTFNSTSATNAFTVQKATPVVTFSGPSNNQPERHNLLLLRRRAGRSFHHRAELHRLRHRVGHLHRHDDHDRDRHLHARKRHMPRSRPRPSTTTGANTISATYTGDANYATSTNTLTTTVGTLTAPTVTLTATGTATVGYLYTLKATLNPTTATGTVAFYDGTNYLGTATLTTGVASLPLGVSPTTGAATGGILTAGAHAFSAVYKRVHHQRRGDRNPQHHHRPEHHRNHPLRSGQQHLRPAGHRLRLHLAQLEQLRGPNPSRSPEPSA